MKQVDIWSFINSMLPPFNDEIKYLKNCVSNKILYKQSYQVPI